MELMDSVGALNMLRRLNPGDLRAARWLLQGIIDPCNYMMLDFIIHEPVPPPPPAQEEEAATDYEESSLTMDPYFHYVCD